jgi:hypothetical protein
MKIIAMRVLILPFFVLFSACTPPKDSEKSYAVRLENEGPNLTDYRLEYGVRIFPYNDSSKKIFGGSDAFTATMSLPEIAVASWRTAPPPGGELVRFEVPISDKVTDEEWQEKFFQLRFRSEKTTLKVFVETGRHPSTSRLIFSGKAK